ncbi:MAG TPA: Asp-tRNA(Asn)/Glu-tRNA(Gln) amidotransferase subunit GatA [Candidatus Paceibacterota bacterium]|nr:Asp-tRNA(Asn)/Glu-tRNA(Gln) amidotransferase subunit GatA [Candidatus Paceibacterota bacterium]
MSSALSSLTIVEASKKLAAGEITSVDLVRACIEVAKEKNPEIHAYLEIFEDAEAQAKEADALRQVQGKNASPLLGIPLAIKDNILIEGKRASAASKMLENYVATYDSTAIAKLKKAGAVFIGRTNMDEFALGGSTENSAFGVTKNPYDTARVAGGTSGGSAAAVAADMALGSLGTDTGGSVRNPASFCGVVGLKPTYGAVSRFGIIAAVSSFDQVGPITKTVGDAELIFNVIQGKDPLDSTSIDRSIYPAHEEKKVIGVIETESIQGLNIEVLKQFDAAIDSFEQQGWQIKSIKLPSLAPALAAYYITNFAEVSSNLSRFDGVRYGLRREGDSLLTDYSTSRAEGFGPETRHRILLGTYVLSAGYYDAYYGKAAAARAQLRKEFEEAFNDVDVIATPTMPGTAWKVGEKEDPLSAYLADIFTVTANLTGNPAISVPMGSVQVEGKELPVGIQFTAAHGDEATLFAVGKRVCGE